LLFLPGFYNQIPIHLITGNETAAEYVARIVPSAAVVAELSQDLPPDTLVGFVGHWDGPQIYTEARLTYFDFKPLDSLGRTPEAVLSSLEQLDIRYIIWDRTVTSPEDWRSMLLSTPFLRDHARILKGSDGGYLIEILSNNERPWGVGSLRNILKNPGLDEVNQSVGSWTTFGRVKADDGIVAMRPDSSIAQRVPVSEGSPYVLVVSAACENPNNSAELTLRWFDDDERTLRTATEKVFPGTEGSEQFLWHPTPDHATSVSAELSSRNCTFDSAALYDLS